MATRQVGSVFPKIIAQQDQEAYLIQTSEELGQVVDWDDKERFPEFNLQSILARGYWEELTAPHPTLEQLLEIPIPKEMQFPVNKQTN
jgi:hypothetical protein